MQKETMPAVVVRETGAKGDWNELAIEEVSRPLPNPGEVLVQVEACSVNRADLLQRRGLYPPPSGASSILGLDYAGFVVEAGRDAVDWHPGDRVFGIVAGGGYGRYAAVPASHMVPIPPNMSFVEAAAAAEVFFTAYLNLFVEARIQSGETLLIHGGGSGVGTAAIQLAREAEVQIIITAGTDEKVQCCIELGASYGINYKSEDFAAKVLALTRNAGVDVILDWIGAPYLSRHIDILRSRGRLVIIGLMGGNKAEIELARVLTSRLRIIGSVLRSRSSEEKGALASSFKEHVLPLLEARKVRPIIDRIFPIRAVEEAHQYLKAGQHFGKVALTWS